ncbi:hypothetical protein MTBBW1_690003 [Desulfamplus magnetovallimortis]|uniref:Uncharacterized protein n=1 Tax=Desulfamplus magnetovallimortis TaxID=1246637 RepID=A0A1W1HIX0_9BACT|nr:hypothetical protein MTBBW1_690003 [Desulfamplus magnetovallimortis]
MKVLKRRGLSYKRTWRITATIERLKVFIKTATCGDFHIKFTN